MEEILMLIGFFLAFAGIGTWINIARNSKSKRLICQWAEKEGHSIVSIEKRLFRKGPFYWTSSGSQLVYYVVLTTPHGQRRAYIRCGGFWAGLLSDNFEIEWD